MWFQPTAFFVRSSLGKPGGGSSLPWRERVRERGQRSKPPWPWPDTLSLALSHRGRGETQATPQPRQNLSRTVLHLLPAEEKEPKNGRLGEPSLPHPFALSPSLSPVSPSPLLTSDFLVFHSSFCIHHSSFCLTPPSSPPTRYHAASASRR